MNEQASVSPQNQAVANSALPLQALIFDMDGVLCDTMPYHLDAWLQYSATIPELAVASRDRLEQMGGKRNEDLLPELLGRPVAAVDIQRWGSEKEAVYRSLIKDEIQWMSGLIPFLQQAQTIGLKLGLGTSACRENVDLLMNQDQDFLHFRCHHIHNEIHSRTDPTIAIGFIAIETQVIEALPGMMKAVVGD